VSELAGIEIKEFIGHKAKSIKEQSEKKTVKETKKQQAAKTKKENKK